MRSRDLPGYGGLSLLVAAVLVRLMVANSAPVALGLAAAGVTLFLVFFFRAGRGIQGFLSQRSTQEGGNVLATGAFVLGIVVLVNLLATEYKTRIDVTEDKLFTLAPETQTVLRQAPLPPRVWVFYPRDSPQALQMRSLIDAARQASPDLESRFVDPAEHPLDAVRFGLRDYNCVIEVGERQEVFPAPREEDFLAALVRAYRPTRARIAFLEGHGEGSPVGDGPQGMAQAAQSLRRRGYALATLDLNRNATGLETTDVVVVAAPQVDLQEAESTLLRRFLDRGGSLLALLDPAHPVTLEPLLDEVGVTFLPRFLADPTQEYPQVIHTPSYSSHPAVVALARRGVPVALPGVGELTRKRGREGVRQAALIRASRSTVVADDPGSEGRVRDLAVAAERTGEGAQPARVVVVGDADFPTNNFHEVLGNGDLFLGIVQWLGQEESLIELRPRDRASRPVVLKRQQGRALMVLVVGILPLAVLVAGTVVWWKRR